MEQDRDRPGDASAELPSVPDVAAQVFGDLLPVAVEYCEALATDGVVRGLLGPREVPRLWERHILNCATLGELLDDGERLVDIGSGAGLPGIPVAMARPGVEVVLVEPLQRRVQFLEEFCDTRLPNVRVVRGRAEEKAIIRELAGVDAVTSRAVSGFPKLAPWSAPLLREGGRLLAIKGSKAFEEIEEHGPLLARSGLRDPEVVQCGAGVVDPPTTVVRAFRTGGAVKPGGVARSGQSTRTSRSGGRRGGGPRGGGHRR
ncbi:16S rRNA (guanine(527)-N(7))-methyltransferase RsmG [Tsukamurella sp. 8F]|uniref:16S rRNA (guanine(527)-N(7))-methyltransferase RsmG n=1 Tax=unclassified Tsukamurella TaxID=2633480 RepID=UPI0023B930EA|nr:MULTISPECIES: 16S rRNA (guanine(527)-N(7))-methyltransferase RsmG [unclassified Tsukamurella]MDF0529407.1 16S rRNA (guanine(527)-N(7))-methyltransferase RsmG [Tsukamurella sp. 8J]MDF0587086.1 16S rRNA (guanine(527)-N(7))-methyltransferase RsmG [Tsukamurella sp. 8F]